LLCIRRLFGRPAAASDDALVHTSSSALLSIEQNCRSISFVSERIALRVASLASMTISEICMRTSVRA
jgi:hypothetical protein